MKVVAIEALPLRHTEIIVARKSWKSLWLLWHYTVYQTLEPIVPGEQWNWVNKSTWEEVNEPSLKWFLDEWARGDRI